MKDKDGRVTGVHLADWERQALVEQWWGSAGGVPYLEEEPYRQARIMAVWMRHEGGYDV
ncbi:MAG: hypothetical protein GY913_00780 [Proteobacteria bacterium]|nr:hypothetical protein [Pseudomonadota bacterium]